MTQGPDAPERGMLSLANRGPNDMASCSACGWEGVPTYIAGIASTYCPACEDNPPQRMRVGRNEPCPCGSGRKSKKCCH